MSVTILIKITYMALKKFESMLNKRVKIRSNYLEGSFPYDATLYIMIFTKKEIVHMAKMIAI